MRLQTRAHTYARQAGKTAERVKGPRFALLRMQSLVRSRRSAAQAHCQRFDSAAGL